MERHKDSKTTAVRRIKKLERETCACGDILCNKVNAFLNFGSRNSKCSYKHPREFKSGKCFPHKRKRSTIIHDKIMLWRKQVGTKVQKQM